MQKINFRNRKIMQKLFVTIIATSMVTYALPTVNAYADEDSESTQSVNNNLTVANSNQTNNIELSNANFTNYEPEINETIDESGFKHPGVGLTKEILENMRSEILNKNDPWYTYYTQMRESDAANISIKSENESSDDSNVVDTDEFNSTEVQAKFIKDALKAYTQSLLYYITGNEAYRANAIHIIRIWSQMDPSKYKYYTDACIHTGIPLNRMVSAAEILRYSSCQNEELEWTDKDTEDFTNNLITPVIDTFQHDNNHFMNQHNYPLLGAIAGYIFKGDKERYDEAVEWFTVNKTAKDQGQNGSVKQLFRLVDKDAETGEKIENPRVQHVEMGRDQAHGGGDLTNMSYILRLLTAQGTKVDPVEGTISNSDDAVTPYKFLDDRILHAADYFWQYMLGYQTDWTPVAAHTDEEGNPTIIYDTLSEQYRGRMNTANFWDIYYYYKYVLGEDVDKIAPYFSEAFKKRLPSNYYYQGKLTKVWDCVDGGGDFWIYIPKAAESEGSTFLPQVQTSDSIVQLEDRYASFDDNSSTEIEGDDSYIKVKASTGGTKIAELNLSYPDRTKTCIIGLKFRTNGTAKLELRKRINSDPYCELTLPDTNGEWRYLTYNMNIDSVPYSETDSNYSIVYMNIIGDGTNVDLDSLNVKAGTTNKISIPTFNDGDGDLNLVTYADSISGINYDFTASDTDASKSITYKIDNIPENASLDKTTGKFSWKVENQGEYSFIISADDGSTVCSKKVTVNVYADRMSSIEAIVSQKYDENNEYTQESLNDYITEYNKIINMIDTSSDEEFTEELKVFYKSADDLKLVTPILEDGSIDYSGLIQSATSGNKTSTLTDGDNDTYPEYQTAVDLGHVFDFGYNYKVSADKFQVQCRKSFPERGAGVAVFGSDDGENWTRLTEDTTEFNEKLQTLKVMDEYKDKKFRYIKAQIVKPYSSVDSNITNSMLELSEFRIFGKRYEMNNAINYISISSDNGSYNRIVSGDDAKLTFTSKSELSNVKVKIQGKDAEVTSDDNKNWVAKAIIDDECDKGNVKFSINYDTDDNEESSEVNVTTDGSSLYIADESDLLSDVVSNVDLIDSTSGRKTEDTLKFVNRLFDDNYGVRSDDSSDGNNSSDFRLNGGGSKSYIIFDFKEGNEVNLSMVELLSRQDKYYTRISGTVVEGSNDGETWTTLTDKANATRDWQKMTIKDNTPYRYIRLYNSNAWYGNMDELKLHIKSDTEEEDKVTVKSVEKLDDITVIQGTSKGDLDLPELVDLELSDDTTTSAAVKWTKSEPDYDEDEKGTYKFIGKITLPDDVENPENFTAEVEVIVTKDGNPQEGDDNDKITVKSVEKLDDITVKQGTSKDDIDLPELVDLELSDNTTTSAAVKWSKSEPDYDEDKEGTYKFVGKLVLLDYIENSRNLKAEVNVVVKNNDDNVEENNSTEINTVKIIGSYQVGKTLSAELLDLDGKVVDTDNSLEYRWYREDNNDFENEILVGENSTYELNSEDKNKYIRLVIRYNQKNFEDKTSIINGTSTSTSHHSSHNRRHSSSYSEASSTVDTSNNVQDANQPSNNTAAYDNNLSGWKRDSKNNWVYYYDSKNVIGWNKIDNVWYLFDNDGIMKTGWNKVQDKWYYLEQSGAMVCGWIYDNNKWYYLNEDGSMKVGWFYSSGQWYYLNENGDMQTGWKSIDGRWYFFNGNGAMAHDTSINGYALNGDGQLI